MHTQNKSENERLHLLNKKVALDYSGRGFKPCLDSVLVAAAAKVKEGQRVLDAGCGIGAVSLCILERVPGCAVTALDHMQENIDQTLHNASLNKGHVEAICADLLEFKTDAPFDHVVTNPPFYEDGTYMHSPDHAKASAYGGVSLARWISSCGRALKSHGCLTLICPVGRLDDALSALSEKFGAVEIIPLWPRQGQAAKRVILHAVKGRQSPVTLHGGLVLHDETGAYTKKAEAVLRDAVPIF